MVVMAVVVGGFERGARDSMGVRGGDGEWG